MNVVYYFSGTGNSQTVARCVAEGLGCEATAITVELLANLPDDTIDCERAVVVFPSYAYGLPKLVSAFLKRVPFAPEYLALAVTCRSSAGGSLNAARRVLGRRGVSVDLGRNIRSVENFLPIFGHAGEETVQIRLENQRARTEEFLSEVLSGSAEKIRGLRPFSALVSGVFRLATPLLARGIRVDETCNGCELCRKICPADAIEIGDSGRPRVSAKLCNQCQACLNYCPNRALHMWRHNVSCPQYRHPDAPAGEQLKR